MALGLVVYALVVELEGGHGKSDLGGGVRRVMEVIVAGVELQIAKHGSDVDNLLLRRLLEEGKESDGEEDGTNDVDLVLYNSTRPIQPKDR